MATVHEMGRDSVRTGQRPSLPAPPGPPRFFRFPSPRHFCYPFRMEQIATNLPERRHPSRNSVVVDAQGRTPVLLFVTVCTRNRDSLLANESARECILNAWKKADNWLVGRYVIMPDHLHFFCSPAKNPYPDYHAWLRYWKSEVARHWPYPTENLWQREGWDTQLRNSDSYSEKWSYVRNNPVRKNLVSHADAWPFQGEINKLRWYD